MSKLDASTAKNFLGFGTFYGEAKMKTILLMLFALAMLPISESFAQNNSSDELTDEQICGKGNVLINGICTPKSIWDSSDFRGLQTGQTMSNPEVVIIIQSLGAILIVLFVVIYAIKKRMRKNEN